MDPSGPAGPAWPHARAAAPIPKGRGTGWQIVHRFERQSREGWDDGWGTLDQQQADWAGSVQAQRPPTRVSTQPAGRILSENDSPDIAFRLALNPYRGCEHGCIYCYARPTHAYLNLSPGLDFETQLMAKPDAAEALRKVFSRPGYVPEQINIGSATDVYQPIEREWRVTQGIVELMLACRHPFSVVTKSAGILRDLPLLAELAQRRLVLVFITLTTLDHELSRILEPRAASPTRRLQVIQALSQAGVPVGVNIAPVIPFINEPEIERIAEAAASHGARSLHWTLLRLPWEVNPLFQQWLDEHFPDRAARVMARVREWRGGQDYDADPKWRMKGQGVWASLIRQRMEKAALRHGLSREVPELDTTAFIRPAPPQRQEGMAMTAKSDGQLDLFGGPAGLG